MARLPDKLAKWGLETLTQFNIGRSHNAALFGLLSKADVTSFIETTLLMAPSLENTVEFREACAAAEDENLRMMHVIATLPAGLMSHLAVADAPDVWFDHYTKHAAS